MKPMTSAVASIVIISIISIIHRHGGGARAQQQLSDFVPAREYLINCGGGAVPASSSPDGREWAADAAYLSSPSPSSYASSVDGDGAAADPLATARIFPAAAAAAAAGSGASYAYAFAVDAGSRYWVRLYFAPDALASGQLSASLASFAVTVGVAGSTGPPFTLLYQFNPSDGGGDEGMTSMIGSSIPCVFKEYSIDVLNSSSGSSSSAQQLVLGFVPSSATAAFGYINAVEVVSAPAGLFPDKATPVAPGNTFASVPIGLPYAAMQTVARINVGGPAVGPANDSAGLFRTWAANDAGLVSAASAARGLAVPVSAISYSSSLAMHIAPPAVYSTALASNFSASAFPLGLNLSWSLPGIDPAHRYLVRLHFCDLQYTASGDRVFDVFLQNVSAYRDLDIQTLVTQQPDEPFYWDFAVDVSEGSSLWIDAGPRPGSADVGLNHAIVNGIEVWKLNNSFGSLDKFAVQLAGAPGGAGTALSVDAIVGITAGGCAALALLLACLLCFCCRRSGGGWKPMMMPAEEKSGNKKPKSGGVGLPLWSNNNASQSGGSEASAQSAQSAARGSVHTNTTTVVNGGPPSMLMATGGPGREFTFAEILAATGGFDEARIIGVGGFGKVYFGELEGDDSSGGGGGGSGRRRKVAVKRGSRLSQQGILEFRTEIEMLSKLRHRHLVSLIGYCEEEEEMILVYEYMSNGAFRDHLYGNRRRQRRSTPEAEPELEPLTWKQRLEICIGATRGIHYLHTGVSQCIIHRDLKSTNILLDDRLVAKVADFGLSKEGPLIDQTHVSTAVKGSLGYLDPEYFRRQKLTEKSDVYSLGVVLLEALCARPVIDPRLPREEVNIVDWALQCKRMGLLEHIVDPCLLGTMNGRSLDKFVETVEKCLDEQGAQRPTVGEVLWNLEHCLALQIQDPPLPPARPIVPKKEVDQGPKEIDPKPTPGAQQQRWHSDLPDHDQGPMVTNDASQTSLGSEGDAHMSTLFSQIVNPQGR